jgi:hypothetical protein
LKFSKVQLKRALEVFLPYAHNERDAHAGACATSLVDLRHFLLSRARGEEGVWSETAGEDENGWVFVDMTFARDVAVECGAVTQNKMQLVRTVDTVVGSAVNVVMQPWSPVDDAEADGEVVWKAQFKYSFLYSFYSMTEYSTYLIIK